MAREVDQHSRATRAWVRGPTASTRSLGRLRFVRGPAGSTSSPGRLEIESEGPRCRPALLGDPCSCLRARGVEQPSREIGFGSDGRGVDQLTGGLMPASYRPWGRPAVPGDSGQCARACNDHHPSWATYAGVRGPAGLTSCSWRLGMGSVVSWVRPAHPGDSGTCPRATMSTSCPGSLGPLSQSPCCRPAVLDDSPSGLVPAALTYGPGRLGLGSVVLPHPRALPGDSRPALIASGVEQFSLATRARVRFPAGSASCHGRLRPLCEGPRRRPAVLGDLGPGPRSCGVHQLSRGLALPSEGPWCPPVVPGASCSGPWACGFDQHSRAPRARVRVPAGLISTPGRLGPMSQVPRGRSAVQGNSDPVPKARGVDQVSRATWACVPGPEVSTSCPGGLALDSDSPRV